MLVWDDVLVDPEAYRAAVLARPFHDIVVGADIFHGIQLDEDEWFPGWIVGRLPQLTPTLSFFRQSPLGQREPNYVHTDSSMGQWTALLYLTPAPPPGDGTRFWQHRATGAQASTASDEAALADEQAAWRDAAQWDEIGRVDAKFGRVVLFAADRYHSRAIPENYGAGDDARLVQVVFGLGAL